MRALRWVTGAAPIKTAFLTCVGCETRLTTVYEPGYNPAVVAWHLVHCPVQTCQQLLKIDVPGHLVMIEPAGPSPSAWSRFTSVDGLH